MGFCILRDRRLSDPACAECRMVNDIFWTASTCPGPARDLAALGCDTCQHRAVLEDFSPVGRPPDPLSDMDKLCDLSERWNLALEKSFDGITNLLSAPAACRDRFLPVKKFPP